MPLHLCCKRVTSGHFFPAFHLLFLKAVLAQKHNLLLKKKEPYKTICITFGTHISETPISLAGFKLSLNSR